ncbi:MAG TPA: hypothetical protein VH598_14160 [Verrucomicrobiae bacterium]|nr:hypothetical protein [Verrucomicrobiae bacterium]
MAKEIVQADVVMQPLGDTRVVPGTFVQRAGLWLAAGVGALIAIVTITIIVFLFTHYPHLPTPSISSQTQADTKIAIENYKELSGLSIKSAQDLFQTIVAQTLLPIFTAILGYIFAKGEKQESK